MISLRCLAAVLCLVSAVPAFAEESRPKPTAEEVEQLRAAIRDEPILAIIAVGFPEEHKAFIDDLVRDFAAGALTAAESHRRGAELTSGLVAKHGTAIARAPEGDLVEVARTQAVFTAGLKAANAKACAKLFETNGIDGAEGIRSEVITPLLNAWVYARLKAMGSGLRTPVTHPEPSQQDWNELAAAFTAAGGSNAWLQGLGTPAALDAIGYEERCRNAVLYSQAITQASPGVAARVMSLFYSPG